MELFGAGGACTGRREQVSARGVDASSQGRRRTGGAARCATWWSVVVVVVVVVVVSGAFCSSLAQDAVKPTIATIATPPATAARRRAKRDDSMFGSYLYAPRLADS